MSSNLNEISITSIQDKKNKKYEYLNSLNALIFKRVPPKNIRLFQSHDTLVSRYYALEEYKKDLEKKHLTLDQLFHDFSEHSNHPTVKARNDLLKILYKNFEMEDFVETDTKKFTKLFQAIVLMQDSGNLSYQDFELVISLLQIEQNILDLNDFSTPMPSQTLSRAFSEIIPIEPFAPHCSANMYKIAAILMISGASLVATLLMYPSCLMYLPVITLSFLVSVCVIGAGQALCMLVKHCMQTRLNDIYESSYGDDNFSDDGFEDSDDEMDFSIHQSNC